MKATEKAIYDLRDTFEKTKIELLLEKIEKLEQIITELELRLENAENELISTRHRDWQQIYDQMNINYSYLEGCQ